MGDLYISKLKGITMSVQRFFTLEICFVFTIAITSNVLGAPVAYDGFEAGGSTPNASQYRTGTGYGAPGDALVAGVNPYTMQGPNAQGFNAANPWQNAGFMPGGGNFAGTVYYQTQGAGLSYSQGGNQLVTTAGSVRHLHEATPAAKDIERTIVNTPTPGDVSYYSFLLRYESEDNNWNSTAELGVEQGASQGSARYTSVGINASGELSAFESHNSNRVDGSALAQDQDHLVVVRLEELAGTQDSMHVWLNPELAAEPSLGSADIQTTGTYIYVGNNASFPFDTLGLTAQLENNGADNPEDFVFFDEFRLGATYADVTPFTVTPPDNVVPEPASIAIWTILGLCLVGYGYRRRK